jgi:hypothetical protein
VGMRVWVFRGVRDGGEGRGFCTAAGKEWGMGGESVT